MIVFGFWSFFGLKPFCAAFIVYMECSIDVKGISKLNKIVGLGNITQVQCNKW